MSVVQEQPAKDPVVGVKREVTAAKEPWPKTPLKKDFKRRQFAVKLGAVVAAATAVGSSVLGTQTVQPVARVQEPARATDLETRAFEGHFRAECKTVMLSSAPVSYPSVLKLRTHLGIPDDGMLRDHPEVKIPNQPRLPQEMEVVTVTAKLFAVKLEDGSTGGTGDNDFHIIVGDSASDPNSLMNVEVSGLPQAGDPGGNFQRVRHQLLGILASAGISPNASFQKPAQPLLVQVTGPVYFDGDHQAGRIGPAGIRPSSVWEIHPVQDLRVVSSP